MTQDYIYIIKTKESIDRNDNVYKVGMTRRGPKKRISSYGSNSIPILLIKVECAKTTEKLVLDELKKHFEQDRTYGIEYFKVDSGKFSKLIEIVTALCSKNLANNILVDRSLKPVELLLQRETNITSPYNTNMPKYICFRCNYQTIKKCHLKDHLKNKKECSAIYSEIDRAQLLEMLENEEKYSKYLEGVYPIIQKLKYIYLTSLVKNQHSDISQNIDENTSEIKIKYNSKLCKKCNRIFNSRQARNYHEKKCKGIDIAEHSNSSPIEEQVNNELI